MSDDERDPELEAVEAIYDALEADDPAEALSLAEQALRRDGDDDPVVRYLAGRALLDLDRPDDAATTLTRAAELDPDDAEIQGALATARFRACRFEAAGEAARRALDLDADTAEAHDVLSQLLDRSGLAVEADRHAARAAALEPEIFPLPPRLDREAFEAEVARAIDMLPDPFRARLAEVAVSVEELPATELLDDPGNPPDPELLGLFVGVPLTERSALSAGGELPARIYLFKRNLERFAPDPERLSEEIEVTLRHELGHYLGMDENQLTELGYD